MPLAWRKPHNARTDAPGGAPREAQHLHGADGARRRPSPGRPRLPQIADILNEEGWRPAKRRDTFNAAMVHHLLIESGAETVKYRRRPSRIERRPNEWTIRELAEEIEMPQPTLYTWVQKGRLPCRGAGALPARQTGPGGSRDGRGLENNPSDPAALAADPAKDRKRSPLPNNRTSKVAMPGRYPPSIAACRRASLRAATAGHWS